MSYYNLIFNVRFQLYILRVCGRREWGLTDRTCKSECHATQCACMCMFVFFQME